MSATTRVNGFAAYTTGTLRSVAQLKAFVITIKDASAAIDLQSLDDGADELVESVIREVQPLMYEAVTASTGVIHVIVDGHAVDAASLQLRLRKLVADYGVANSASYGTEATNITTVVLGSHIVVS